MRRSRTRKLILGLTTVLITASGSWPAEGTAAGSIPYEVVGPTIKVRPTATLEGASRAELIGGRNEFVSFQVVVPADEAMTDLSVRLGATLTSGDRVIPRRNVTIYREAYYRAKQASTAFGGKGRWPDALIPTVDPLYGEDRNAFPVDVPPGENRVAFVDILVPRGQLPGAYEGSLRLSADGAVATVPITLEVLHLTLRSTSSRRTLFQLGWITPCQALYPNCTYETHHDIAWRVNADLARLALDNRVTIANPQFQPPINETERQAYEEFMKPLVDGTADTRLQGARLTVIAVDTANEGQVRAWKELAEAEGFADRAVSYAGDCDEPGEDQGRWDACRAKVEMIDDVWPDLPNVVTTNIDLAEEFDGLDLIDIIVPHVIHMHGKPGDEYAGDQRARYADFLAEPGHELWMYTSCSVSGCGDAGEDDPWYRGWLDYTIDTAASQDRAMGWLTHRYRTTGELYYLVDLKMRTAWSDQWDFGGNGDGTLVYPGRPARIGGDTPIPLESLRLKMIRNGYQDAEYVRLASGAGHRAEAMAIVRDLVPTAFRTITTDERVEQARRAVTELIIG